MKTTRPETTIALAVGTTIAFFLIQMAGRPGVADLIGGFVPARVDGLVVA